jgi:hypothetical protein
LRFLIAEFLELQSFFESCFPFRAVGSLIELIFLLPMNTICVPNCAMTDTQANEARRPTGSDDRVEILYWFSWKEKWGPTGPFGRTVLPLDDALRVIEQQGIFLACV